MPRASPLTWQRRWIWPRSFSPCCQAGKLQAQEAPHRAGGHGVQNVMGPRQGQGDGPQGLAPAPQAEAVAQPLGRQVGGVKIGRPRLQAVGDQLVGAVGEDRGQVRVVGAGDDPGPRGQPLQIRGKHLLDVGQVPVVVQVLPVQVGDDGDLGGEQRKGAVGLVGLGHEIVAPAQDGVGPQPVPHRAHHHGGVEVSGPEDRRGHGGGGGLAVHAGDRHLGMVLHQPGQQFPPAQDFKPPGPGRGQLRVVLFHRGGVDHDVGVPQVFGPVALDGRAPPGSPAAG